MHLERLICQQYQNNSSIRFYGQNSFVNKFNFYNFINYSIKKMINYYLSKILKVLDRLKIQSFELLNFNTSISKKCCVKLFHILKNLVYEHNQLSHHFFYCFFVYIYIIMKTSSSACFCQSIVQSCLRLIPVFGFCHIDENVLTVIQFHQKNYQTEDLTAEKQKFYPFKYNAQKNVNNNIANINQPDKRQRIKVYFNTQSLSTENYRKTSEWKMAKDIISLLLFSRWNCTSIRQQLAYFNITPSQFIEQKLQPILLNFIQNIENLTKLIQVLHSKKLNEFLQASTANCQHAKALEKKNIQMQTLIFEPKIHINSYNHFRNQFSPHNQLQAKNQRTFDKSVNRLNENYPHSNQINVIKRIVSPVFHRQHIGQYKILNEYPVRYSPAKKNATFANHNQTQLVQSGRAYKISQKLQNNSTQQQKISKNVEQKYVYKPMLINNRSPTNIIQKKQMNFTYVNGFKQANQKESEKHVLNNSNLATQQQNFSAASFKSFTNQNDHKRINSFNSSPSEASFNKSYRSKTPIDKHNKIESNTKRFHQQEREQKLQNNQTLARCSSQIQQISQNSNIKKKNDSINSLNKSQKELNSTKKFPPLPENRGRCFESEKVNKIIKDSDNKVHKNSYDASIQQFHEDPQYISNKTQKELKPQKNSQNFVIIKDQSLSVIINPKKLLQQKKKKNSICHQINVQITTKINHKSLTFSEWHLKINSLHEKDQNQQENTGEEPKKQLKLKNQTIKSSLLIDEMTQPHHNHTEQKEIHTIKVSKIFNKSQNPIKKQNNAPLDNAASNIPTEQQSVRAKKKVLDNLFDKGCEKNPKTPKKKNSQKYLQVMIQRHDQDLQNEQMKSRNKTKTLQKNNNPSAKPEDYHAIIQPDKIKVSQDIKNEEKRKQDLINKYLKPKKQFIFDRQDRRFKTKEFQHQNNDITALQNHTQNCRANKSFSNLQGNFKSKYMVQVRQKKYSECINHSPSEKKQKSNKFYDLKQKKENQQSFSQNENKSNKFRPRKNCSQKDTKQQQKAREVFQRFCISHPKISPPPVLKKDSSIKDDQSQYLLFSRPNKNSEAPSTQRQKSIINIPLNLFSDSQQETQRLTQSELGEKTRQHCQNDKRDQRNRNKNYMDYKFRLDSGIQYNVDDKVAYKEAKFMQLKMQAKKLLC